MLGAIILVPIVVVMYLMLCYYIGRKIKILLTNKGIKFIPKVYWTAYWFIALSYVIGSLLKLVLPVDNIILEVLILIGGFSICSFIYLVLIFGIIDIIKFCFKRVKIGEKFKILLKKIYSDGLTVFILAICLVIYGFWNAQNKVITNYEVNIDKQVEGLNSLNIVMVSDIHMGSGVKEKSIDEMVNSINNLNADIVVFPGDLFDESTNDELKKYSSNAFENIKSKYGTYFVTGNHEYISGEIEEIISSLEDGNVTVLKDEAINIDNKFILVGRNDESDSRITGNRTKFLDEIMKSVDKNYPIIVLDHKPDRFQESIDSGGDLQLSGHTHKGQLSPGNLITNIINENDYGILSRDGANLIVSSGYGTWGFPIRIGSKSEIVNIKVTFENK